MAINKVVHSIHGTLIDISQDTVTADVLFKGHTAHGADGELIEGTYEVKESSSNSVEFDILPETTVYYDNDEECYILPCNIYHDFQTHYIVTIDGKTYIPRLAGADQGYVTFLGNSGFFGYFTNEEGSFGIKWCGGMGKHSLLILDPNYFGTPPSVTVRIHKFVAQTDIANLKNEPYIDYVVEDDTINSVPMGAFYNMHVVSVSSKTATSIEEYGFEGSKVFAVDLPNVTDVGSNAFVYNGALVDVNLPSAEYLSSSAFYRCTALEQVVFPAVKHIADGCFSSCNSLAVADFHSLEEIESRAFNSSGAFRILIIRSGSVCHLGNADAFDYTKFYSNQSGGVLLVPRSFVESYKTAENWSTIWGYGNNRFLAIEDYTMDGTIMGEINYDELNELFA